MSDVKLLSEETIRQVAAANDIVKVIGHYVSLKKTGTSFMALCPFHREKNPSLNVSSRLQRYKCFGCGVGGDVFGFVSLIENVGFRDAALMLAGRAGIVVDGASPSVEILVGPKPRRQPKSVVVSTPIKPMRLPDDFRRCTRAELRAVANLRGLSMTGVELAGERGLLWYGTPWTKRGSFPSWIVSDGARINAQARRMDGGAWEHIGNKKAYTLSRSKAAWPVGTKESDGFPFVVVTEGGPDFLAAHHFIAIEGRESDVAAVAILGGYINIPEDALLFLKNKRVRIYPHLDSVGEKTISRWSEPLQRAGCDVDCFNFRGLLRADGDQVTDLNDLANLDADCFEAEVEDLAEVLPR